MQADRQNKIRTAIDGMQELPEGITFNNNRVWDRVEEQIPNSNHRKPYFYYAAAVILLLVGVGSFVWFGAGSGSAVVASPDAVAKEKAPVIEPVKRDQPVVAAQRTPPKPAVTTNTKAAGVVGDESVSTNAKDIVANSATEEKTAAVVEVVSAPAPSLPAAEEKKKPAVVAVKKPVARPYRIIHLNDLDALPQTAAQSGNISKSELRKILQQQEEKETDHSPDNNARPYPIFKKVTNTSTLSIQDNN